VIVPFYEVRREALLALYRLVYSSDKQEFFTRDEIAQETFVQVGAVFFGRVITDLVEDDKFQRSSWETDGEFFTLTNAGWSEAERLTLTLFKGGEAVEGVPASDRIVTPTDNQRQAIQATVEQIISEVRASNEVGDTLGDEKQRIEAELVAGGDLVKTSKVRLGAVITVLATPLRYLAEKFSGAAIGELAKKLLDLLWKLIST
jgi:hypothetical protein